MLAYFSIYQKLEMEYKKLPFIQRLTTKQLCSTVLRVKGSFFANIQGEQSKASFLKEQKPMLLPGSLTCSWGAVGTGVCLLSAISSGRIISLCILLGPLPFKHGKLGSDG